MSVLFIALPPRHKDTGSGRGAGYPGKSISLAVATPLGFAVLSHYLIEQDQSRLRWVKGYDITHRPPPPEIVYPNRQRVYRI
jgi:hypothetical protein